MMNNTLKKLLALAACLALTLAMVSGCGGTAEPTVKATPAPSEDAVSQVPASETPASETPTEEAPVEEAQPQQQPAGTGSYIESLGINSDVGAAALAEELGIVPTTEYFPLAEEAEITSVYVYPPFVPNYLPTGDINEKMVYPELEKLTNVHVDWTAISMASAAEDYPLMLASGDYPDVLYMYGNYNRNSSYEAAIEDEIIIDLNEVLDLYCPSYNYILKSNKDILSGASTASGYISEFISIEAGEGIYYPEYIRQDWLDKLGLEMPETYDEMYQVLTAFKDAYDCGSTLWIPNDGLETHLVTGYGSAAGWYMHDGEVVYGLIQDGFREYLKTMNKWYSEGLISVDFMTMESDYDATSADLINNGQAGVFYVKFDTLSNFSAQSSGDPDFKIAPIPCMVENKGDTISVATSKINNYGQRAGWSISAECENLELVARWCDFWYTEACGMLVNYGIEGNTYEFNDDGKPVWTDMILNNPDGLTKQEAMATLLQYRGGGYVSDNWKDNQSYDQALIDSVNAVKTNLTGEDIIPSGVTLTAEESNEQALILTDIETFTDEYVLKFITGVSDPNSDEQWDYYVQTVQSFDLDRAIEIQKGAYERYMSR